MFPEAMHITDVYFFDEFTKLLGSDADKRWLTVVHHKERKERLNQILLRSCTSPASEIRIPPKLRAEKSTRSANSTTHYTSRSLPTLISPAALDAWDIDPTEQAALFDLERSRSAPAVSSLKSSLPKADFGLLFTDAAHTVIGDLEYDAFVRLYRSESCSLPRSMAQEKN